MGEMEGLFVDTVSRFDSDTHTDAGYIDADGIAFAYAIHKGLSKKWVMYESMAAFAISHIGSLR